MDFLRRALRHGVAPLVFLSLLGAKPPDEGVEASAALGLRRTAYPSGCGRHQQVTEVPVALRLRARTHEGWTVHLEQEVAPATTREVADDGTSETQGYATYATTVARVGYNGRRWGVELGPTMLLRPELERLLPMPSAVVRYGAPEVAYVYLGMYPRPPMTLWEGAFELGAGRAGERWRGEVALTHGGARALAEARLAPGVWLGFDGAAHVGYVDELGPDWQGALRLTLGPEAFRGPSGESTR